MTYEEEEIAWAREAYCRGELCLWEIVKETKKPRKYWEKHLSDLLDLPSGPRQEPANPDLKTYKAKPEDVLILVAKGMKIKDIAKQLGVSSARISQLKNRGY